MNRWLVGKHSHFETKALCLALALVCLGGCSEPADRSDEDLLTSKKIQPSERWEVIYLKDTKIGHQHTTIEYAEKDRDLLRIHSTMSVTFTRFGQRTPFTIDITSSERPDGRLVGFYAVQGDGTGSLVTEGQVRQGKLHQEATRGGETTRNITPWEDSWGGLFAIDSLLVRNPMKPGETRRMRVLMPILFCPADVQLEAGEFEQTELLDGTKNLLKILVTFTIGDAKLEEIRWVDRDGAAYKSSSPQTQQTVYRTTESIAIKPGTGAEVDVAALNSVPVDRTLDNPHKTKRVVYRASVSSGDLNGVFESGASQSVRTIDDRTAEIVVSAISPENPATLTKKDRAPQREDLQPNSMLQSEDELIRRISTTVAAHETDPWLVALALERFANEYITEANFKQAFDSAAEVAVNRTGDCTEHAVLLAALCRARKIPARVAIGLVYLPNGLEGVFAYHMWTEVWIKDRWIPLDATLARGGIGAAHIKLTTSNLTGASPQSVFLPVAQVVGRLKLQIVDAN